MTATTKLALELLAAAAANQTLANTTFAQLNQLVMPAVVDKDLSTPPVSPANEALYIVASGNWGTGSSKAGQLAYWLDSTAAWHFIVPREGFLVHVNDEDTYYKYTGSAWLSFAGTMNNPMTAAGDMVYGASLGAPARLAAGVNGQVLTLLSGLPAWVNSTSGREKLTADRTYYVRTDGSDSNDGLTDSAGGAFLTIQKAVDVANGMLDAQTFQVTVQVRDGTYTTPVIVRAMLGTKPLIIRGNSSTPSNVHVNVTGSAFLTELPSAFVQLFDMKMTATTVAIFANPAGIIEYGNIVFGSAGLRHVSAQTRGYVTPIGSYTIEGGAQQHVFSNNGGAIRLGAPSSTITITLSGTPNFTDAFAKAVAANLYVSGSPPTFSGAATGKRYDTSLNGVINTSGGGATYFPGDVAGTTATGGQYA